MMNQANSLKTTRYTATLPVECLDELKTLAEEKRIPSVNFAIRQAIDNYLAQLHKEEYEEMMKQAASDEAFVARTMKCFDDFEYSDSEVDGEW